MEHGQRGRGGRGGRGGGLKRSSSSVRSGEDSRPGGGGRYRGGRSRFERHRNGGGDTKGRGGGGGGGRPLNRNPTAGGYRPQVSEHSVPHHARHEEETRGHDDGEHRRAGGDRPHITRVPRGPKKGKDVVVILEEAGLLLGHRGIVDAYERAATTELANESLTEVRPDIVHQCLLALCDSELAHENRLRIYISLFSRSGKVIEVSPALRPPRTYARFRGLMASLLREGRVTSLDGEVLMRTMPSSIAPVIPNGAEVTGISNSVTAPVVTALQLGRKAHQHPVDDALQGGIKGVEAFYVVSCTDNGNLDSVDYLTNHVCLSAYPASPHVLCARICEGHAAAAEALAGESGREP